MLKVVIIEDDIFDYTHLKNLINWEKEGFLLVEGANSVSEGIQVIKKEEPDIVITDMKLPDNEGVEIIKYINQNNMQIKSIAVSGYDDFKYVKQSLKSGAVDYILKHNLTSKTLLEILKKVEKDILNERQQDKEKAIIKEQIKTGKNVLIEDFINEILKIGVSDKKKVKKKINYLELDFDLSNLVVVAGQFDDFNFIKEKYSTSELKGIKKSFINVVDEILKDVEKAITSFLEAGEFVILFSFDNCYSEQDIYSQILATVKRIKTTVKDYFNFTASFAISNVCHNITEISKYYDKVEQLLKKKFYEGKDSVFNNTDTNNLNNNFKSLGIKDEKKIIKYVKSLKKDQLVIYIEDIIENIQRSKPSISSVKLNFVSLINIINKISKEYDIDTADVYAESKNPYQYLEKFDTIDEVKDWILDLFSRLIDLLKVFYINSDYSEIVQKAVEYIYKNYQQNVSLSKAADYVGVNKCYLSRKFKKECEQSFVEYLNAVRIEHAKILIKNDYKKIKNIAPEVGFNSYNYFFKVFKDIQGMTPVEYEKV